MNLPLASFVSLIVMHTAVAQIDPGNSGPAFIMITTGQPRIAVFPDKKQSIAFAEDCIYQLWAGVQIKNVSPSEFEQTLTQNPVEVHIPKRNFAQAFAPTTKPAGLSPAVIILPNKDGILQRHYVDHQDWISCIAISGSASAISIDDLERRFPGRGIDLRKRILTTAGTESNRPKSTFSCPAHELAVYRFDSGTQFTAGTITVVTPDGRSKVQRIDQGRGPEFCASSLTLMLAELGIPCELRSLRSLGDTVAVCGAGVKIQSLGCTFREVK